MTVNESAKFFCVCVCVQCIKRAEAKEDPKWTYECFAGELLWMEDVLQIPV